MTAPAPTNSTAAQIMRAPALWMDVTDAGQREATKLRAVLLPVLEQWSNPSTTHAELEKFGVESYAREFGRGISVRHLRRLIQRVIENDGGYNDWTQPELYLPPNPPLRVRHSFGLAAHEECFAPLLQIITAFATPGQPTPEEEALLWLRAWELHGARVNAGIAPKRGKAELLAFLGRHAASLTQGNRDALRKMVSRQFRKHEQAECDGSTPAEAALDGRFARRGEPTAAPIPPEDIEKIAAYALHVCNGRVAQAKRELVDMREQSGLSQATLDLLDGGASKSYVNARLAKEVRPQIEMARPYILGKKAVDDATPSLERDYSKLHSLKVVTADDLTCPVYAYLPNGKGWYELTRGQCLLFIDVRSLKILTWTLIPDRVYHSLAIRSGMNSVCLDWGLPSVWYFENGLWRRSNLVKNRPPKHWRLAHGSNLETAYGWERLGVRFIHATRARSKPAEIVCGLVQNLMERYPGYCGRDERHDCPEETRKNKLAVEARRVHPREHFYSFEDWTAELGRLIDCYNATKQEGRILDRRSPDQAFKEFWPENDPPSALTVGTWHLCAHYVSEQIVTPEGITFQIGNERFNYRDEQLGHWHHQKVRAWFDPGHPEILGVTNMANKKPFFVQRSNPVDFLAALDPNSPEADAYRRELSNQAGFASHARAVFKSTRAIHNKVYRTNLVPRETAVLSQELLTGRNEALQQSNEQGRRRERIIRNAGELGWSVATLRDFSEETDLALRRQLERKRKRASEEAPLQ